MLKFISRALDRIETKLSLWVLLGGSSVSFALPAWGVHASEWLSAYGPIGWICAGFIGVISFVLTSMICITIYSKVQLINLYRKLSGRSDAINPMDMHFHQKRVYLQWFVPPSGDVVVGKTFSQCEIIGPINIIPFNCLIANSLYISSDYIMISDDVLKNGNIRNGQLFRNCQFIECMFYFTSFLVSEAAFDVFDRQGGCNWITNVPARQPDLLQAVDPPPL